MSPATIFVAASFVALLALVINVERARSVYSYDLVVMAVLGAVAAVSRIPFAGMPSVQPVTFIVICSGVALGARAGMVVGVLAALLSNSVLGHGPWTLVQMLSWGAIGLASGYLDSFRSKVSLLVLWGAIAGFVFGWFMDLWFWLAFAYPLSLSTLLLSVAASAWFDGAHAATNAALLFVGGADLIKLLRRYRSDVRKNVSQDFIEIIETVQ